METDGFWKYNFVVRSFDVDISKQMTMTSISEYLQEVAGNHANSVGFGYRQVIHQNMVWILNGIHIEIERLPVWEEEIEIKTWVVNNRAFISRRDFEWSDARGNVILTASTNWILFNTEILRPQLVEKMNFPVKMHPNNVATKTELTNIREKFENDHAIVYSVKYSDLDMVGHMNNTKYIQLIFNSYNFDFLSQNQVHSISINFKAEAKYMDDLELITKSLENNVYFHQLKRAKDNIVNCIIKVEWGRNKKISK